MKEVALQLLSLLGLVITANIMVDSPNIYWSDLGIIEQIRVVFGLFFIVGVAIAAIVIFKSIWVKNGYAGIDSVLVDKEVALFMSHVLAFILIEIFFFMILFINYVKPPEYAFWICGFGFLSPEVVRAIHYVMEKFKSPKPH